MNDPPTLALSHFELYTSDVARLEDFYRRVLGFVATDRGAGPGGLVFLSRSPHEHHQIVLNPRDGAAPPPGTLDHVAFRVSSLAALRRVHAALRDEGGADFETVSHGTTWSIYFRDPDGNRLEVFTDTPWYVSQPVRFTVDLTLSDEELLARTEDEVRTLAGYCTAPRWRASHAARLGGDGEFRAVRQGRGRDRR